MRAKKKHDFFVKIFQKGLKNGLFDLFFWNNFLFGALGELGKSIWSAQKIVAKIFEFFLKNRPPSSRKS